MTKSRADVALLLTSDLSMWLRRNCDRSLQRGAGASNCLKRQAGSSTRSACAAHQGSPVRITVLRIVSSFRMHATSASFFGLTAASSRR